MKKVLKKLADKAGYRITRMPEPVYGDRNELESYLEIVRPYTMLPEERLVSLYDQVCFCEREGVGRAYVECGVWKGGAVGLMALAAGGPAGQRDIHLFDAFTDICDPDPEMDGTQAIREAAKFRAPTGELRPLEGFYDEVGGHGTLEGCQALLESRVGYPSGQLHYHVGWFQDTVPKASSQIPEIGVLRLDGDWHASTKVCLEHLFDHIAPGGFLVIDDYGTYEGCRRAVDDFLATRAIPAYLHPVDASCFYLVKAS